LSELLFTCDDSRKSYRPRHSHLDARCFAMSANTSNGGLFGIDLTTVLYIIVIAAAALILERVFVTYVSRFAKRAKLERNAANNLVLTFRILILISAVLSFSRLGGLSPEWILSISAIAGAALGFASQKTLGNFLAGLFLLAARPFKVGEYVRIGTVEGIVEEITINYTKVLTIGNNTVSISNLQILDRDITNFKIENKKNMSLYCYTYEIGFDHSVSAEKIMAVFNEVFERFLHMLPRNPSVLLTRSDAFVRVYTIYLYVEHPEDIFTLRPQVSEEVFKRWDMERNAAKQAPTTTQPSKEEYAKIVREELEKLEEKDGKPRKSRR
jgi:small-conductance mechanosensitive channel